MTFVFIPTIIFTTSTLDRITATTNNYAVPFSEMRCYERFKKLQ